MWSTDGNASRSSSYTRADMAGSPFLHLSEDRAPSPPSPNVSFHSQFCKFHRGKLQFKVDATGDDVDLSHVYLPYMCFLPSKFSYYPSRPVPVPDLFCKYPTRPVPKSKTPTRRTLIMCYVNVSILQIWKSLGG